MGSNTQQIFLRILVSFDLLVFMFKEHNSKTIVLSAHHFYFKVHQDFSFIAPANLSIRTTF